jgi:hypothetical protein
MDLAIQTLAKDANISKLASANDVSRKYLYQKKVKPVTPSRRPSRQAALMKRSYSLFR